MTDDIKKSDELDKLNEKELGAVIRTANLPELVFDEMGNLDMIASQEALISTSPVVEMLPKKVIVEAVGVKTVGISQLMLEDTAEASLANDGWAPIP